MNCFMNANSLWLMATLYLNAGYEIKNINFQGFLIAFVFLNDEKHVYRNMILKFTLNFWICQTRIFVLSMIYRRHWIHKLTPFVANEYNVHRFRWWMSDIDIRISSMFIFINNIWLVSEKQIWPYQIIQPSSSDIS